MSCFIDRDHPRVTHRYEYCRHLQQAKKKLINDRSTLRIVKERIMCPTCFPFHELLERKEDIWEVSSTPAALQTRSEKDASTVDWLTTNGVKPQVPPLLKILQKNVR